MVEPEKGVAALPGAGNLADDPEERARPAAHEARGSGDPGIRERGLLILDTSALVAIALGEPAVDELLDKLMSAPAIGIGTPSLAEAGLVLSARLGRDPRGLLARLIQELGIVPIPFGDEHWKEAIEAYRRHGKGRHRAELNFGDCLSYATAKLAAQPLLCTGSDFTRTDLPLA